MSLGWWIVGSLVTIAFWLWVAFWGGAERIEDSFVLRLLVWFRSDTDAESIKLYAWLAIAGVSVWFVVGLFVPTARFLW